MHCQFDIRYFYSFRIQLLLYIFAKIVYFTGMTGAVAYPLQGLYLQLTKSSGPRILSPLEWALITEGRSQALHVDNQERASIISLWELLAQHDPSLKKKFKR